MENDKPLVDLVTGARPNFIKAAPVQRQLARQGRLRSRVVHTGQHYDRDLSGVFFEQLEIPRPEVVLEAGSGTHGAQTARILERYESHLLADPPAATVVFGDVNSTVACALAATKLQIPVVHVEAGLRSFDRTMPEEINRILTDAIADLLFVTEASGLDNLEKEGVRAERVRLVGNVMIDTLLSAMPRIRSRRARERFGLEEKGYGLLTLHRPANVDDPRRLRELLDLMVDLSHELRLVFPVHPRTAAAAERHHLDDRLGRGGLIAVEPQAYVDHLSLMADARVVLTDSGGMQEETSVLGVPCLTLRESTERPVTLTHGTSRLVGRDPVRIREAFEQVLEGAWPEGQEIPLWDGRSAERIAAEMATWLSKEEALGG